MAQLVKLYDYISRYESNPFHYPTQFIRLKQENWRKLENVWLNEQVKEEPEVKEEEQPEKKQRFLNWKLFGKKSEEQLLDSSTVESTLPKSKEQLVQHFLNQLLPFQYKWATSTISHVSYTDKKHIHDDMLTYFLQRFPDIYLLLYYPIFSVKNAPIDGDIILISPIGIDIIHVMKEVAHATIIVNDNRSWTIESQGDPTSMISPLLSLKRTEQIVHSILQVHQINFPIQKVVLSKTNDFLYHTEPYQTQIIGKRQYENWFKTKRQLQSPLKSIQLKVMEALLHHCHSTSVRRPEWERDNESYRTMDSFEEN